jgi:hypothetical protein
MAALKTLFYRSLRLIIIVCAGTAVQTGREYAVEKSIEYDGLCKSAKLKKGASRP